MNQDFRIDDALLEGPGDHHSFQKQHHGSIRDSDARWIVLLLAALACLGDHVNTNLVKSFEQELKDNFGGLSQSQFNILYFIAPEVNIVLPLAAGFLITRFNLKTPFHWFAVIAIIGQFIVSVALWTKIWTIMVIGRAVGALGGASLAVARSVIVSKWFAGKELSFALGAHLLILVFGRHLGYYMVLWVYNWSAELYLGFLAGTMGCCCSWYAVFHLCDWDKRADRQEERSGTRQPGSLHFKLSDLKKLKLVFFLIVLVIAIIELGFTSFMYDPKRIDKSLRIQ
jgi:nitrate/nitrite transporter NarK